MSEAPISRRSFLYATTGAVAAVGIGAVAWPLIHQGNPDAAARAAGDVVELDLTHLAPAELRKVQWRGVPILVVRRTPEMLDAMQDRSLVRRLIDPDSEKRQQPSYTRNWHRSIDPGVAVIVGICTGCGCVPAYFSEASVLNVAGGYVCPCCASYYDAAGRVYRGLAQYNLPVPPHRLVGGGRLVIGMAPGDLFSLDLVERI